MALEHAGKSILEMLWDMAVLQYGNLMELHEEQAVDAEDIKEQMLAGESEENAESFGEHAVAYLTTQGKLRGIAYCIAKILNPAKPDVDDVKQQIREKWEAEEE